MERWLLSQLCGKILVAGDTQNGLGPVDFARNVLESRSYAGIRRHIPISDALSETIIVEAEIWQGGWVVHCPFCSGLEYGDPAEPLFRCCSCWNFEVAGKLLSVRYPPQWRALEVELLKRSNGRTRGWIVGETLQQLRAETKKLEEG